MESSQAEQFWGKMEDSSCAAKDLRPVIYVTGFGPFPGHPTNASQLAVELLPREDIEEELGVRLVTEIVRVEYDYVKKTIPRRWRDLVPKLTIHVGVSNVAETLTLEQLAHNTGYERKDIYGCTPYDGLCHPDGSDVLQSFIRMDLISSTLNKATCLKLPCIKSTDPGRFLCDFIYYLSLKEDQSRSAFIHVPTLLRFTAEEISAALAAAIKEMYMQVLKMDSVREATEINGNTATNQVCHREELLEKIPAVM